jgi:hypothetical protein
MVASVVERSWPLADWDGPSAGSSFAGLFLGGISWVFCRAHEHDGRQCWDLLAELPTQKQRQWDTWCRAWKIWGHFNRLKPGARAGLFIVEDPMILLQYHDCP